MSDSDCFTNGGAPAMNTDISGIGVRVSFYLQALFLACLSARSGSLEEITGALYTLVATNMAMAVTSLILGFKTDREISYQDALVVFYLLSLSWAAVFFSLPSYNRFLKGDTTLKFISVFQSYLLFTFALALLIKAETFGSNPECNGHAVVVLFRPFSALHAGRIIGWVVVTIVIGIYTFLTGHDYKPMVVSAWKKLVELKNKPKAKPEEESDKPQERPARESAVPRITALGTGADDLEAGQSRTRAEDANASEDSEAEDQPGDQPEPEPQTRRHEAHSRNKSNATTTEQFLKGYDMGVSGNLLIELIVIVILWALTVMNTELLIRWNHFEADDGSPAWQFGQILPMFLIVLPLVNLVKAFWEYRLHRRVHRRKVHKKRDEKDNDKKDNHPRSRRHGHDNRGGRPRMRGPPGGMGMGMGMGGMGMGGMGGMGMGGMGGMGMGGMGMGMGMGSPPPRFGSRSPFGSAPPFGFSSPFASDGPPMDFLSSILGGGPSSFRRQRPDGENPRARISERSIHDGNDERYDNSSDSDDEAGKNRIEEIEESPSRA